MNTIPGKKFVIVWESTRVSLKIQIGDSPFHQYPITNAFIVLGDRIESENIAGIYRFEKIFFGFKQGGNDG